MAGRVRRLVQKLSVVGAFSLAGCGAVGAPSFGFFGTYFPAWMLCALIGIAAGTVARIFFVAKGLTESLPFQLLLCTAIGVIIAVLAWILLFGL